MCLDCIRGAIDQPIAIILTLTIPSDGKPSSGSNMQYCRTRISAPNRMAGVPIARILQRVHIHGFRRAADASQTNQTAPGNTSISSSKMMNRVPKSVTSTQAYVRPCRRLLNVESLGPSHHRGLSNMCLSDLSRFPPWPEGYQRLRGRSKSNRFTRLVCQST